MMNITFSLGVFLTALLSGTAFASGEFSTEPGSFDEDRDGDLSEIELAAFLAKATQVSLMDFDLDIDDTLSDDEVSSIKQAFKVLLAEARRIAEEYSRRDQPPAKPPAWGVLIRRSHADVDLKDPRFGRKSATSASFSMTEDIASDSSVIGIKGAVLRPIALGGNSQHWLVPGVELNRLSNQTEPDREIDSLTFRLGSDFYFESDWFRGGSLHLRVSPLLTTNLGFDVDVRALEVQLEPDLRLVSSIGPLEYDFRMLIQSEYGEVVDAGNRTDLRAGDRFSRIGVKMGARFWPTNLELLDGVEGILSYERFEDFSGDLRARQLLRAGFAYQFELISNLTLETSYTRGDTSVALEDEETWTIGLGIKL